MNISDDVSRARRAYLLVATVIPMALTVVAVALMLVWLPSLPDPVATHWGISGGPDGFGPAWLIPLMTGVVGLAIAVLFGLIGARGGGWGPVMRFLGAMALATSSLLLTMITLTVAMQRGLADAQDAPGILVPVLFGAGACALGGIVGWFTQPAVSVLTKPASPVTGLALQPSERAVWVRTTTMAPGGTVTTAVATAVLVVLAIAFAVTGDELWLLMAGLAVLFAVLIAATLVFRVRVSDQGLRVASSLGIPFWQIPLDEISAVEVVQVQPMADFGGWGFRFGLDGRFGVVLRAGAALQVARTHGRVFTVTVSDAETGAALLQGLRARAEKPRR
jgi:Protein of unknown function (DUF1648)